MSGKLRIGFIICVTIIFFGILMGCISINNSTESKGEITATASPVIPAVTVAPAPTETKLVTTPTPMIELNTPTPAAKHTEKKIFPILYYHAVNDIIKGIEELFVSPKEFEKQMEFLKQNDYQVITFEDLENIDQYEKPVIITFDDGYEDNYIYAYPILKKYNFKATIFQVADFIGNPSILNKEQMKEMGDLINFQSHTLTHPHLTQIKLEEAEREIQESKKIIEKITGKPVTAFAYPIGDYNEQILDLTRKYYKYAVCNGGGLFTVGDSPYEIKRVYIPRRLDIEGFGEKIKGLQ